MKAGLVSVSFRKHTIEEIITAVKAQNLTHIEWGSDVHAPYSDLKKLQKISALCKENDITCSYGTYFRFGQTPIEELPNYIAAAKILGANILRVWCGTKSSKEYTMVERNEIYQQCRQAAKLAEKEGVVLCTECHNWTLTDDKDSALALFQAVNSPAFQTFYQPNQFKSIQENIAYAKAVASFTKTVHVFNWEKENKYPLSQAIDTWKEYLSCFSDDLPCLLEFMPGDTLEELSTESRSLFKILKS